MLKLKRIVSALCIFVLLWAAVMADFNTVIVYAAATNQIIPFTDNCNYPAGNTPASFKWEKVVNNGLVTIVRKDANDNDPNNNCIALGGLKNSSTSPNPYLNINFTDGFASTKTVYEFSIKMNTNAASKSLSMQLRDSAGANGWSFATFAAGSITGVTSSSIMTYTVNQWYKVQAIFDFTAAPYKYTLCVKDPNGNTAISEYAVPAAFTSISNVYNRISFYDGGANDSAEVDAFIDDVNVYRAPANLTIAAPVIEQVIASNNIVDITNRELVAGTIRGSVNISPNHTGDTRSVTVIFALCQGDIVKDITSIEKNISVFKEDVVAAELAISQEDVDAGCSIIFFVWDKLKGLQPLGNYVELRKR